MTPVTGNAGHAGTASTASTAVTVTTVLGAVPVKELGITLCHEHLRNDGASAWHPAHEGDSEGELIADSPLRMEFLGRLRNDPYLSRDNVSLDDTDVAIEEVARFAARGGRTLLEVTPEGIGRAPAELAAIARATGLNIVMGCGFYLERTHPARVRDMSVADVADEIVRDLTEGVGGVRAGVIGEIGVSPDFTAEEEKVLRGAARAQARAGVPLSVHLPGWVRHGHRVLDVIAEEGGSIGATVLSHLNPSGRDRDYQVALATRGAYLGYDMCGMEYDYPGEGQSPCDDDNAAAIAWLHRAGLGHRVLLSQDVFLKTMLVRYGGTGYAHILTHFVPRLHRHGLTPADTSRMLADNPRDLFLAAAAR
ncbi:phosphotriesterase-related protein [Microtetraspora sp. NBRC 16547]|uniref:phosphotriesterase family protein n=1 Tax=Microtetraspora sp. NBRC 16547 TaxID=3030993 RepID=UPI0024A5D00C|nr:phosphotriesterase-related protein [Microtetraspora sp. NBRC 16547]GLW99252.1 aryldialkylphosphatase [Microtetraspora sp. NBRC 16547]